MIYETCNLLFSEEGICEDITTRSVESNFCNDDVNEGSIYVYSETIIDNEQKINKSLSEDELELGSTDNNKTADCELQPLTHKQRKGRVLTAI